MLDTLSSLFTTVHAWLFEALVEPALYQLGLLGYAERAFDALEFSLYGVIQIGLMLLLLRPLGLFSLMAADAVKQIMHALVTGALLAGRVGGFRRTTLWPTLAKVVLASGVMAGCAWAALAGVQFLALPANTIGRALLVAVPGAVGVVVYFFLAARLNIAEVQLAVEMIRRRLRV